MKLSRFTPANKIEIKAPIWNTRSIGIATYKIGTHNEVHISTKHYPQPLYISGLPASVVYIRRKSPHLSDRTGEKQPEDQTLHHTN